MVVAAVGDVEGQACVPDVHRIGSGAEYGEDALVGVTGDGRVDGRRGGLAGWSVVEHLIVIAQARRRPGLLVVLVLCIAVAVE